MKEIGMGITHVDKILSEERIDCDGILNVTLSVTAQPDVVNNPVDIALFGPFRQHDGHPDDAFESGGQGSLSTSS